MSAVEEPEQERTRAPRSRWRNPWTTSLLLALIFAVLAVGSVPFVSLPDSKSSDAFEAQEAACACPRLKDLTGVVEDCCCEYETVYSLNHDVLNSLLGNIVKQPFFRYFKVKLWCDCPFWPEDGMCRLRDCSVCECPDEEFPKSHKEGLGLEDISCQEGKPTGAVDRTLDTRAFRGWTDSDNPWTHEDDTDTDDLTYVNLLLNPEGFTGYVGQSARRIWEAIYQENCFPGDERDTCTEARVMYRLISGVHASITSHIAADYLLDEATGTRGRNPELLHERVLKHQDRVQNLYFTFLFVLRAVTKASDYLSQAEYSTGNPTEDRDTLNLMKALVDNERLRSACPLPFDEAQMWRGDDGVQLREQLQHKFRNISALMDCVGCEKCRLWGKLQTLGLGTALKILFSVDSVNSQSGVPALDLQRNEVIALINLLHRLSESLEFVHDMGSRAAKSAVATMRR